MVRSGRRQRRRRWILAGGMVLAKVLTKVLAKVLSMDRGRPAMALEWRRLRIPELPVLRSMGQA
jgi:hypothetical protein